MAPFIFQFIDWKKQFHELIQSGWFLENNSCIHSLYFRFLATGIHFQDLQYEFHVAKSTIKGIVQETCAVVWSQLKAQEMPVPTTEMWKEIADLFYKKMNFPNCVGAVDGKHIRFRNPKNSGSEYFNYKKYFSLVLMAIADANLSFIMIDVGAYGSQGDSTIFQDSPLGRKLYTGTLNLPPPQCLPNTSTLPQPFTFVADEAFRLHTNLQRPFPQRNLDPRRRVYNYRLSRCRRSVECAFGILANKWKVFHTPILVEPDFGDDIIKACCILHNFVRRRDGYNFEDTLTHPCADIRNFGPGISGTGPGVREVFADYFMGVGAVPFQNRFLQ